MPKTTFYIVRHGETEANVLDRFYTEQENLEMGINDKGREQAQSAAEYFAEHEIVVDKAFSSQMQRAIDTAHIIAETNSFPAPVQDKRINEQELGDYYGRTWKEFEIEHPDLAPEWDFRPVGGEAMTDMRDRLYDFLKENHAGDAVIFVTHGAVIELLLKHFTDMSLEFRCAETSNGIYANCDIFKLIVDDPELEIINNYLDHA